MNIPIAKIILRSVICLFWTAMICMILMLPTIGKHFFQEKSLTIFTWPLLLDPIYLKKFEKETGIKLYITYFENGSALLSKLAATKGAGYDIIIPDDHSLQMLIKQGLLKNIDKQKVPFFERLNSQLRATYADPENTYSVPYYWGIYGVGYDALDSSNEIKNSWSLLFPPADKNIRVCMTDDPREAIMIAAQYLFGSIDALKDGQAREQVKQLLIEQKKSVDVYSLARSDNLLQSKSCNFGVIISPELWRLSRERPNFQMAIPQEGTFLIIDSFAIPKTTTKDDLIYQFINYVYQPTVIMHHTDMFGFCSPFTDVSVTGQEKFCPAVPEQKLDFFRDVISDQELNELWIEVLAA